MFHLSIFHIQITMSNFVLSNDPSSNEYNFACLLFRLRAFKNMNSKPKLQTKTSPPFSLRS